jgi:hypothetical protein
MSPVKQGHIRNLFVHQFGAFAQRNSFNHEFDKSNPQMGSPCPLERTIRKVIERLEACFATVTLAFDRSRACFNNVLAEAHDGSIMTMRADQSFFMLLLLNFINHSNRCHTTLGF